MKTLITIIALIVTTSQVSNALSIVQPEPQPTNTFVSRINNFQINHSWLDQANMGSVSIKNDEQEIVINLNTIPFCGINEFCIPNSPEVIQLPIVETFVDNCGATHYIAEQDKTPVDGLLQQIEVINYMTMTCEILVPFPTETFYVTFNPRTQKTTQSTFTGGQLERLILFDIPKPIILPLPQVPQFK